MPRSPLTEQYRRVMSLVEQLHALEPDERNFILDLLVPEPEPEAKPAKKTRKKAASKKSARASSLSEQIHKRPRQSAMGTPCGFIYADKTICAELEDNPIHDKNGGYAAFHPFQLGASTVTNSSPANGAENATAAGGI